TCLTRAVFSSCPVAFWNRRLNCSFFSFDSSSSSWSGVIVLTSTAFMACPLLLCDALYEARLDRELGCPEPQRLARNILGDTVDLEHDAAGLHAAGPELDRALALTHTNFGGLCGDRNVRKHPDPHATLTLHLAGDGAAGSLDLPSGDPLGFQGLEAESSKVQV